MSGFLSFLLVVLVAGAFGVIAMMHKLKEPGPLAQDKIVYLPPGSDAAEMIAQLQRAGDHLVDRFAELPLFAFTQAGADAGKPVVVDVHACADAGSARFGHADDVLPAVLPVLLAEDEALRFHRAERLCDGCFVEHQRVCDHVLRHLIVKA